VKALLVGVLAQLLMSAPVPGGDAILGRTDIRYIVIGESHGTSQTPATFGDLIAVAARGAPVVAVVELSGADQPLLDAYLTSQGGPDNRRALLKGVTWAARDGRSSVAMLELVERLRQLRVGGADLEVIACQPFRPDQMSDYEKAMGQCWRDAGAAFPKARILVLVGNWHADRAPSDGRNRAIAQLPVGETLALIAASAGGEAWSCKETDCGPKSLQRLDERARGIYLTPGDRHFDGIMASGGVYTASPPVFP
jgi:hypothetical protein